MKRMPLVLTLAICCAVLFAACSSKSKPSDGEAYHKITAEEAKKMLDEGGVTVVDVRTAEEYAEKHIPDAVLVPVESIGTEPPELLPDKDAVLLIHCRTGVRSKQASDKLVKLGYTQIYDFGGIVDWPYETIGGSGK
ncbi:rhodanese-like domain-containing protein [Qiania dongpingensis]|uniref:Rhodanese-like domain-containing protein n=1 Tax=Qiania dongpingensis TaxID=2763669 RepID=A0A7G9G3D9_9FIRM|nr:rhodanese-like domain-containing protein [Qiania dongpingensis]QNM05321.1 rhodanese-like domain-containing protein [Qiania dongpingensis]